jgi:hypothetical protein
MASFFMSEGGVDLADKDVIETTDIAPLVLSLLDIA